MNIRQYAIGVLGVVLAMSASAAQPTTGIYLGVKAGQFQIDDMDLGNNIAVEFDKSNTFGVIAGYDFGDGLAVELDYYAGSTADVDIKTNTTATGEYEVSTLGVYGVYRFYPELYQQLFFKAKFGLINEEVSMSAQNGQNFAAAEESDTGFSFGAGLGFNITPNVLLEAEYTVVEQDVNLLSAGLNFKF